MNNWKGYDPIQAILGQYSHSLSNLRIRLQYFDLGPPLTSGSMRANRRSRREESDTNEYGISTLLAIADVLADHTVDVCSLDVNMSLVPDSTVESVTRSLATSHLSDALQIFADKGWPKCFTSVKIAWHCDSGSCNNKISARHLITKLPSALRSNHAQSWSEDTVRHFESQLQALVRDERITSYWNDGDIYQIPLGTSAVGRKGKI